MEKNTSSEKKTALTYVVGAREAKKGVYKANVGTEKIGYFDPWKVVVKVASQGWQVTWPPDEFGSPADMVGSKWLDYSMKAGHLQTALGVEGNVFGFGSTQEDMKTFFLNLLGATKGEVGSYLHENTVLPFFKRYSAGEKIVMVDEVNKEVMLNSLINFLISEVEVEKANNTHELKELAEAKIRELRNKR